MLGSYCGTGNWYGIVFGAVSFILFEYQIMPYHKELKVQAKETKNEDLVPVQLAISFVVLENVSGVGFIVAVALFCR
jgi:hypothetical protein